MNVQPGTRLVLVALTAAAPLLSSCEGLGGGSSDCATFSQELQGKLATEGALSDEVAEAAPYPMALILSQAAINRLFAAIADNDLPPLTFSETVLGVPVGVTLRPSLPLIQVGGELGCGECLLTELDFGLTVDVAGAAVSGDGLGRYQFPLTLQANGLESTRVLARLGESSLLDIDLNISGVDSAIMDVLEPLIADAATLIIRDRVGDTELFELGAWTFGDGDVRMLGRGPIIEPDFGTVVIGMHSNLIRPLSGTVEVDPALPAGADIGVQLHPELVHRMVDRMLHEGHIARSYGLAGQADANGIFDVSMNSMQSTDNDMLRTNFRLWRTSGGLCGSADLQADLAASISDRALSLRVANIEVTDGQGAGTYLLNAGNWLQSAFATDMARFSALTINYDEIELPGEKTAEMSASSFSLNLDGRGISLFLNIDAITGGQ